MCWFYLKNGFGASAEVTSGELGYILTSVDLLLSTLCWASNRSHSWLFDILCVTTSTPNSGVGGNEGPFDEVDRER
jgi:hypothetical protein